MQCIHGAVDGVSCARQGHTYHRDQVGAARGARERLRRRAQETDQVLQACQPAGSRVADILYYTNIDYYCLVLTICVGKGLRCTRGIKHQFYQLHSAGLILCSSTWLEDVPAAKSFSVDDVVVVRRHPDDPAAVLVSISFEVLHLN